MDRIQHRSGVRESIDHASQDCLLVSVLFPHPVSVVIAFFVGPVSVVIAFFGLVSVVICQWRLVTISPFSGAHTFFKSARSASTGLESFFTFEAGSADR